jgi:hypothetical protein
MHQKNHETIPRNTWHWSLSLYLRLGLSIGLHSSGFPINLLQAFLFLMLVTDFARLFPPILKPIIKSVSE